MNSNIFSLGQGLVFLISQSSGGYVGRECWARQAAEEGTVCSPPVTSTRTVAHRQYCSVIGEGGPERQRTQTLSGCPSTFCSCIHLYNSCTFSTLENKCCLIRLSTSVPLPRTPGMEDKHPGGSGGWSNYPKYPQDLEMLTTPAIPLSSWSS